MPRNRNADRELSEETKKSIRQIVRRHSTHVDLSMSLGEAQEHNINNMHEHNRCVCCGRPSNPYKVVLSVSMIEALSFMRSWVLSHPHLTWMHISKFPPHVHKSRIYMKLRYWGFVEQREKEADNPEDEGKKDAGEWRITNAGVDFLNLDVRKTVRGACWVYNSRIVGWDDSKPEVDVLDVVTSGDRSRFNLNTTLIDYASFQELENIIADEKARQAEAKKNRKRKKG